VQSKQFQDAFFVARNSHDLRSTEFVEEHDRTRIGIHEVLDTRSQEGEDIGGVAPSAHHIQYLDEEKGNLANS
jgi:hypothetical protein